MQKLMKQSLVLIVAVLTAAACSKVPKEAFWNRGQPESLLDVSSEVVNVSLGSPKAIDQLTDWVNQDQPSRAELYCLESSPMCAEAKGVLEQFGVPVMFVAASDNTVALVYERVLARDCENRFIDNNINPYNMNYPTFGCSVSSNIVQHVSDKQQFVSPALSDSRDAEKTVQVYRRYEEPPLPGSEETREKTSLLEDIRGGSR